MMGVMKRISSGSSLSGFDKLHKALKGTEKATRKSARSGINAGLTVLARSIRAGVRASSVSQELKKASTKAVGKTIKKTRGDFVGKAGFSAGKPTKKKREAAHKRYIAGQGGKPGERTKKGTGVSATNIHWFVLGTDERRTGIRTWKTKKGKVRSKKTGNPIHRTGRIKPFFTGIVKRAASSSAPAMLSAARKKTSQVFKREVQKLRNK